MLKRIKNYSIFMKQVGILDVPDFDVLPIKPSTPIGIFDHHRIPDMIKFCQQYPEYHIVSHLTPFIYLNCLVDHGVQFLLAKGDNDPNLILIPTVSWEGYVSLLISKLWSSQISAE